MNIQQSGMLLRWVNYAAYVSRTCGLWVSRRKGSVIAHSQDNELPGIFIFINIRPSLDIKEDK